MKRLQDYTFFDFPKDNTETKNELISRLRLIGVHCYPLKDKEYSYSRVIFSSIKLTSKNLRDIEAEKM